MEIEDRARNEIRAMTIIDHRMITCVAVFLLGMADRSTVAQHQPSGCFPQEQLPDYITPLTDVAQRAEWSLDSKSVYYVDKAGGDVWKVDIETKIPVQITNPGSRPAGHGYYRVYALSNGDLFFTCGSSRRACYMQILKNGNRPRLSNSMSLGKP